MLRAVVIYKLFDSSMLIDLMVPKCSVFVQDELPPIATL